MITVLMLLLAGAYSTTTFGLLSAFCTVELVRVAMVAVHEAGHAAACIALRERVCGVEFGWDRAAIKISPSVSQRKLPAILLAGPAATIATAVAVMITPGEGLIADAGVLIGLAMAAPEAGSGHDLWSVYLYRTTGAAPDYVEGEP